MLSVADRQRLLGVLGRLASEFDGERAAAGLLAARLLRERGLGWDDVIAPPPPAAPEAGDWRRDALEAGRSPGLLTAWERAFVAGILRGTRITEKQAATLAAIVTKVQSA